MHDQPPAPDRDSAESFSQAANEPPVGLLREFVDFLRYQKKWWLLPICLVLLLLGLFVYLMLSPAAPFIYTIW